MAAVVADVEKHEPAVHRTEATLRRATPFCPPLKATAADEPGHKVYELRLPNFPPIANSDTSLIGLAAVRSTSFTAVEFIPSFMPTPGASGLNMLNMAYMIPFESADHRNKVWGRVS